MSSGGGQNPGPKYQHKLPRSNLITLGNVNRSVVPRVTETVVRPFREWWRRFQQMTVSLARSQALERGRDCPPSGDRWPTEADKKVYSLPLSIRSSAPLSLSLCSTDSIGSGCQLIVSFVFFFLFLFTFCCSYRCLSTPGAEVFGPLSPNRLQFTPERCTEGQR